MKIKELRCLLDTGKISVLELTKMCFDKIKTDTTNSFITLSYEKAIEQAKASQKLIDENKASALTGIPFSAKDNICTENIRTTAASKMLDNFIPSYNATVIDKLYNRGAVILGKANMDEFAMGTASNTSYYGVVKNPVNNDYIPGGSSGGSAASVKADLCAFSLGSDTGGSVRQPAAYCGTVGLKSTYGSISRYGLISFASSLDQIGIIANNVDDTKTVFNAICSADSKDMTSTESHYIDKKKIIIGIDEKMIYSADKSVTNAVLKAIDIYKSKDIEIISVSLPSFEYVISAYYTISSAEAASNLARYDGIRYGYRNDKCNSYEELISKTRADGFGDEVKRRIFLGNYVLSEGFKNEYYNKALMARNKLKMEYDSIFKSCDVIISPTTPTTAPKINEFNRMKLYNDDMFTIPPSLAGLPSMSVPCGCDENNMPIGMCLTANSFNEALLFDIASIYESEVSL